MKRLFKKIGKIIIYLLAFIILLTGFIIVSRNINGAKVEKELAYKTHPKWDRIYDPSPQNISVQKRRFNEGSIKGYHHIPNDIRHKGVIITFGGSGGGMYENISNYLSSDGYEVVSVIYFGEEGQPQLGESIPLEIYEEIYRFVQTNCKNTEIITLVGGSQGAQLALLLSTYYDSIDNVVLVAPTAYTWGHYDFFKDKVSFWTYNGKEVEYLNGKLGFFSIAQTITDLVLNKPQDQLRFVNSEFKNSSNLEESRIKVEKSYAKILIFYGGDDRMLDAKSSSNVIEQYAKNEIIVKGYENAGHAFGSERIIQDEIGGLRLNGGDLDSNIEADLDSKRLLLETLERWHK